jgi:predicted nuclease of restriction endonuclease-like (RecB) superfamily
MTENKDYIKLTDLKAKIRQAQYKAYRAVNTELISLYRDIGQSIAAKQEDLGWGQKIIQKLSEDLQNEFPKNSGFSYANLDRMRKFYLTYKANPKLAQLVRENPWGHNIVIIEKLNDDYQREYYLRMTVKNSWSRNILVHQIETKSFERFLADKKTHNFDTTLPVEMQKSVEPVIKDNYMLERAKVVGKEYLKRLVEVYNQYRMGDRKSTERGEREYKPLELVCCEVLK